MIRNPFRNGDLVMAIVDGNYPNMNIKSGFTYQIEQIRYHPDYNSWWRVKVKGQDGWCDSGKFVEVEEY